MSSSPSAKRISRDLISGLLDLVFAPICVGCGDAVAAGADRNPLCPRCIAACLPVPPPRCPRCWSPLTPVANLDARCTLCPELPPALRVVRSACLYDGAAREAVHALKYSGWQVVAHSLGARMAKLPLPIDVHEEARWAVPVPLAPARLRQRGFNQAQLLADGFAAVHGCTVVHDVLVRRQAAGSQTALHPSERRANVDSAFQVPAEQRNRIRNEHILLIDDVWTTGATAVSCTQTMLEAGARVVSVITFARAVPELKRRAALF